jgi:hypothetical protein
MFGVQVVRVTAEGEVDAVAEVERFGGVDG